MGKMITEKKQKLLFLNKSRDNDESIVKVKFNNIAASFLKGRDMYFCQGKRRGRKSFFSIPYTKYINNEWECIEFYSKASINEILEVVDIYDEQVEELSLEEALDVILTYSNAGGSPISLSVLSS